MKRLLRWLLVPAVLLLCLATNPSQARHQKGLEASFARHNRVLGHLGVGALYAQSLGYHNLLLCSYTRDDEAIRSFGLLGMVFTF